MKMIVPFSPKGFEMRLAFRSALLTHVLATALLLGTLTSAGWAQNGTWLGATGDWNVGGTWSGGIIADGANNTANFTGVDINSTRTVNLGVDRTIGNIIFTDAINSSNNLVINNNTLTLDVTTGAPVIDVTQSGRSITIGSVVAGNDGLTKNGLGILTLANANTYTGVTTINAGEINLTNASGLNATATGAGNGTTVANGAMLRIRAANNSTLFSISEALTIAGNGNGGVGAVRNQVGITTLTEKVTLSADATINANASSSLTLNVAAGNAIEANNFNLTVAGGGVTSINDTIALGTGGLTVDASGGTVNLNAANTYSGTTSLSQGTLALGNVNALQNSTLETTPTVALGRAVTFTVADTNTYNLGGLSGNLGINIGSNTLSVGANNANTSTVGVLTGAGGLTKVGNGTLNFGGAQQYTGATNINGGTLNLTGATILAGSTVNVGTAGTLTGGGTISGNATLTGNGIISLGDATIGGTLEVTGGNWNGVGTVTGAVTSSSGTFNIGSGAILTANGGLNVTGGTIAGTGTIKGPTLFSGGALAPGNSIGILNNVGDVTWNGNGANWIFEIGAGNTSDLLNITGNFNKGSSGTFTFDFGGSTEIGTFKLVDWTSGTTFAVSDFSYLGLGGGNTGSFAFGGDGSQLNFSITAVPEPTSMVLVSLVGVAGVAIQARRRKMKLEV